MDVMILKEIKEKLESIEKKIDTIESNVGTLMGRDEPEYHIPIDSNFSSNFCLICNRLKENCICFKPEA